MKKAKRATNGLRSQYKRSDFGVLPRGKYLDRHPAGTNVVFLEPDVAKVFPDSASVNRVLRLLMNLAERNVGTNNPV